VNRGNRSIFSKVVHYLGGRVFRLIHQRLVKVYGQKPSAHRDRRIKRLTYWRNRMVLFLYHDEGRAERWTGFSAADGAPLKVAYLGNQRAYNEHSPEFLITRLFTEGQADREDLGDCRPRDFINRAHALADGVDMVVIEQNRLAPFQARRGEWLRTDLEVRFIFEIKDDETWEDLRKRFKRQKRNLSLIRRHGFTCRVASSPEEFDFFYDRMYIPMVQRRHSGYGKIEPRDIQFKYFQSGVLLQVLSPDNQPVSAGLLLPDNLVLFYTSNGLTDGSMEWFRRGALAALYYFSIQYGYENGFRILDLGSTRPFLRDGIYTHKSQWDMQPVEDWRESNDWTFWVPAGSEAAFCWLRENLFDPRFARWSGPTMEKIYTQADQRVQKPEVWPVRALTH